VIDAKRAPLDWRAAGAIPGQPTVQKDAGWWALDGLFGGNDAVRAAPFDAIEIKLARLWGEV
jgi:hypothetical protein